MNLDDYHITDITQCSVGDVILAYTHSYSRIFMSKATITRLMKTRFDLEFEDGRCGTYRTRNTWCVLESFGAHRYPVYRRENAVHVGGDAVVGSYDYAQ